jgi:lipopolysaccharide biosynthesis regulator YciM
LELQTREDLPDDTTRLDLILKGARWLEDRLDRPAEAAAAYRSALEVEPGQLEAMTALERLYVELGQQEDLLDLLVNRADLTDQDEARRNLLERAARLAHEDLGLLDRAIACYARILSEFGPERGLLEKLCTLYESAGQFEDLYRVLTLQLDQAREHEPEQISSFQLRLGQLAWHQLDDSDRAIPHLNEALYSEATHDAAQAELATLYEQRAQWPALVELLLAQLPLTVSDELRLELSLKGARIAEENLEDPSAAIALYEEARQASPADKDTAEALYQLLAQTGRWSDLLAHLEADMGRYADDKQTQVAIALRIAKMAVNREQLAQTALGRHYLNLALNLDPGNVAAARLLARLNVENGEHDSALDLLGRVLAATTESNNKVALLVQRGEIYLETLEREEDAAKDFTAAFQLDETNTDVIDRLADLLTRRQAWSELITMYQKLAKSLTDVQDRVDIALKVAGLVEEHDLPRDQLIRILEDTLATEPPYPLNTQLILKVIAAHRDAGDLGAASAYVEKGLADPEGAENKTFQAELCYYKGRIAQTAKRPDEALAAHQVCYDLDSGHVLNLLALSHLLYEAKRWDEAVKVLQVALLKQSELTTQQKVDVYYMMGMAWVQKGDRRRARDMFNRVLGLDRDHGPTLNALESL